MIWTSPSTRSGWLSLTPGMYTYVYVYACMHVKMSVYFAVMFVRTHICVCLCMYARMHAHSHARMYECHRYDGAEVTDVGTDPVFLPAVHPNRFKFRDMLISRSIGRRNESVEYEVALE